MISPVALGNFCSSVRQSLVRGLLLLPLSAVIRTRVAFGYRFDPMRFHHRWIAATANSAVSLLMPIDTPASFRPMS